LKITSAEYLKSAVIKEDYPKIALPEIIFSGRSNVGKSSLINSIVGRKNLAKTSSVPGKTRTLNFYLINNSFYIVDLPGYGFAKVPDSVRKQWSNMISDYFNSSCKIISSFLILDSRRDVSELDIQMIDWFKYYKIEPIIIITKIDKLKKHELLKRKIAIIDKLIPFDCNKIVLFSAKTGQGKKDVMKLMGHIVKKMV